MLNDTPDLDVDAPIDYVLTELGRETVAELSHQWVCVNGIPYCRHCYVCGYPAPCGRDHGEE